MKDINGIKSSAILFLVFSVGFLIFAYLFNNFTAGYFGLFLYVLSISSGLYYRILRIEQQLPNSIKSKWRVKE